MISTVIFERPVGVTHQMQAAKSALWAPELAKINSMNGQDLPNGGTLDLSFVGGDEADMTEAVRAMFAPSSPAETGSTTRMHALLFPFMAWSSTQCHPALPKGRAAIDEETVDLRKDITRDESTEWSEVRHIKNRRFTPMSGLLFIIMGQKNSELVGTVPEDQCRY
jgi:hypothetical protein